MDEVGAFERRLRRAALARVGTPSAPPGGGSGDLDEVLAHVARRRSGRSRSPLAAPASVVARAAPTGAPAAASTAATANPSATPSTASPGQVLSVEQVSPSLRLFRVGRPTAFTFTAGQYLKLGLPGNRNGSFSLASAPHEPFLELCIELIPDGRLTPALFGLRVGDRVVLSDRAKGAFTLDTTARVHLMVATGSGIGPLRSMLRDALHRGLPGEFVVVHGSGQLQGLPYRAELEALARGRTDVRYLPTVSSPDGAGGPPAGVGHGRVDPVVERLAVGLDPAATCAYLCGHPGMIASVAGTLRAAGVRVRAEAFD